MDELLEQFLIEGRELVAEAHDILVALGRDPQSPDALTRLFRAVHTLKGSVALFDMAPSQRLLHVAETRLADARSRSQPLDVISIDGLVAIIDQTDRWIDTLETDGALGPDADDVGTRLAALLSATAGGDETDRDHQTAPRVGAQPSTRPMRVQISGIDASQARTMFRYTPDTDCFFRGEDPLSVARAVPGLLGIAVVPTHGAWPPLEGYEPFRCVSALEGVSAAPLDQVAAALRLVADQVRIVPFSTDAPAAIEDAPRVESAGYLRIQATSLDQLADLSGDLGVAVRALPSLIARLNDVDPALAADFAAHDDRIARTARAIQHSVAQLRQISLEPILRRLPRLAREAAASVEKSVRFTLEGETVRVDKRIADHLFEPLLHLIRNAIDHGIEAGGQRIEAGKPAEGHIQLTARQDGSAVIVRLSDDGRGIDPNIVRAAAVTKGLIAQDAADALSDKEALRLILLPGFSTRSTATALSGRGVGMDAVSAAVEKLQGHLSIESELGHGVSVELRLPANAIVTPLLTVTAGGHHVGLRVDHIVETARIRADAVRAVGLDQACLLRDVVVPVFDMGHLLGADDPPDEHARLVVTDVGGTRVALRVARFGERIDMVVREPSGLLRAFPAISGTATMADGSILLVLDLAELLP